MKKTIIITHASPTFGFGIDEINYEQVYIPKSLMQRCELRVDDVVDVLVRPNDNERNAEVPWFAFYVIDDLIDDEPEITPQTEPDPAPEMSVSDMVMSIIGSSPHPLSTNTILTRLRDEYGHEDTSQHLGRLILVMHERGEVARACIKQQYDQRRASFVLWSLTTYDFMGANNG